MEKDLEKKLEEYSILCQNLPDIMMVLDQSSKILLVSGPFEQLSGIKVKDIIGTSIFDLPLIKKEYVEEMKKNFAQRMKGEKISLYRVGVKNKAGKDMVLELSGRMMIFRGKEAAIFIIRDVTSLSAIEEELKEERERYKQLFNQTSVGVGLATLNGKIIDANRAAQEIMGYSLKEFKKIRTADLYAKTSDREAVLQKLKKDHCINNLEVRLLKKGKKEFDALLSVCYVKTGKETFLQTIFTDITDLKRKEKEELSKAALLKAQTETTIDGLLAVDEGGKTILANKKFAEMWGIPKKIIVTKDDEKMLKYVLLKLKYPDKFLDKVKYLYSHKDAKSRDEIEFKDGRIFDRYSAPLENGGYYGRIWYFRDITDRKKSEEGLRTQAEELERINKTMVGRELKMIELKEEIAALKKQLKRT